MRKSGWVFKLSREVSPWTREKLAFTVHEERERVKRRFHVLKKRPSSELGSEGLDIERIELYNRKGENTIMTETNIATKYSLRQ